MGKFENKKLTGKLKGVFNKLSSSRKYTYSETEVMGYSLLMDIVDRKVFDVEDSSVSSEEFEGLATWSYKEFKESTLTSISGRVIREDPLVIVEVVEDEPVFIEIHDYNVRYRVNLYHATQEVEIEVVEPVKDKELEYQVSTKPVYVL